MGVMSEEKKAEQDERRAFEAWFKVERKRPESFMWRVNESDAWEIWQAHAASTSANVAQGAEAYQYRDVVHWFREIAGARVLNHVLTEMTHSELAVRAFSAGRALTAAQSASGDKS
jgi:hypothetical protein